MSGGEMVPIEGQFEQVDNPLESQDSYRNRSERRYLQVVPYDGRLAAFIVARIAEGEMPDKILNEYNLSWNTFRKWQQRVKEFRDQVRDAQRLGSQKLAEECVTIADEPVVSMQDAARKKLQIETRLKLAAKYDPSRYGDKAEEVGEMDWGKVLDEMKSARQLPPAQPEGGTV